MPPSYPPHSPLTPHSTGSHCHAPSHDMPSQPSQRCEEGGGSDERGSRDRRTVQYIHVCVGGERERENLNYNYRFDYNRCKGSR